MITKRATLLAINSLSSSSSKVFSCLPKLFSSSSSSSSIEHSFDSLTVTATETQLPSDLFINLLNNEHHRFDIVSSEYVKNPHLFDRHQNGVYAQNVESDEFQHNTIEENGNFGGYDGSPQRNQNGTYDGFYGRSDNGYRGTVNGNYSPNVGQLHQGDSGSYMGNVGMNQHYNVGHLQQHQIGNNQQNENGGVQTQYSNTGSNAQNGLYNRSHEQNDADYRGSVTRSYIPDEGQFDRSPNGSYTVDGGMNQQNISSNQISNGGFIYNNVGQNGNFGRCDRQSYVTSPQQGPDELYNGSYACNGVGYQGIVNRCCNPNVGQFNQIMGDSYTGHVGANQLNRSLYLIPNGGLQNGNIEVYDRQSYVLLPQQSPTELYKGSYGRTDAGYQTSMNQYYYPNVAQFHQTAYVGMNRLNTSSYQILNGGVTCNNVGQNGSFGGYDRQSNVRSPQQSPNGSYGQNIAGCPGSMNRIDNPNAGPFQQSTNYSYTANVGMNQHNLRSCVIPNSGLSYNSDGYFQAHQSSNDQRVQTQNSYYRNNAQSTQQTQDGNVGNNSNPTSSQPNQQNPNESWGNNGGHQQTKGYQQRSNGYQRSSKSNVVHSVKKFGFCM